MYSFYSRYSGYSISEEDDKAIIKYYQSKIFKDYDNIIEKYSLEDKTGKQIQNILLSNNCKCNYLYKMSKIYDNWYLYKSDNIIGYSQNLV